MNLLDLILLVLLSVCAVRGYVRGLFREVMGLAGLVLGGAAAVTFWRPVASELHRFVRLEPLGEQVLAGILVFVAVNLSTHVAGALLERLARAMALGGLNRLVGAVVGLGKALVVVGLILFLLRAYVPVPRVAETIDGSVLGAPITEATAWLLGAGAGAVGSAGKAREA